MTRPLIELCAGSAALSLHLSGLPYLMPYWGGKARNVKHLAEYTGAIDGVELYDIGPWGDVWSVLPKRHAEVCAAVAEMVEGGEDPEEMWHRLSNSPPPADPVEYVAVFLVLQRLAFRARPVRETGGSWNNPGIGRTVAYGRVNTTGTFRDVKPQLPGFLRKLRAMGRFRPHAARRMDARDVKPRGGCVVLLDPPYEGTTGYGPEDLTRDDVHGIVEAWTWAGSDVLLTEAAPRGIVSTPLRRVGRKRRHSKVTDWLTVFPARRAA